MHDTYKISCIHGLRYGWKLINYNFFRLSYYLYIRTRGDIEFIINSNLLPVRFEYVEMISTPINKDYADLL